ncbi:MAG: tetratricopeptide repeat protein [bacterium]
MRLLVAFAIFALSIRVMAQSSPPAKTEKRVYDILDAAASELWSQTDVYWHKGQHYHVMSLLYMLIEIDPQGLTAYDNLGWLLESNHKDAQAIEIYKLAIKNNPNSWEPYFDLGNYYYNKKQYDLAIVPLKASTERVPSNSNPWRLLAHSYTKLDRLEEALEVWNKILMADPKDVAAKLNRDEVKAMIEAKASEEKPK